MSRALSAQAKMGQGGLKSVVHTRVDQENDRILAPPGHICSNFDRRKRSRGSLSHVHESCAVKVGNGWGLPQQVVKCSWLIHS